MSSIMVLGFDDPAQIQPFKAKLQGLVDEGLLEVEDAVLVTVADDGTHEYTHFFSVARGGAVVGGILGGIVGLMVMNPIAGAALGAAGGSAIGKMTGDYGIDEHFIETTAKTLTPGATAVFLQVRRVNPGTIEQTIDGEGITIITTRLADEAREFWTEVREQQLADEAADARAPGEGQTGEGA